MAGTSLWLLWDGQDLFGLYWRPDDAACDAEVLRRRARDASRVETVRVRVQDEPVLDGRCSGMPSADRSVRERRSLGR